MSAEHKRCGKCHELKCRSEFYVNRRSSDGLEPSCKACRKGNRYGISSATYDELFRRQGETCAVCRTLCPSGKSLAVDHDHACCPGTKSCGKCVRGLLCLACNTALGGFRDSPELLARAIHYLTHSADYRAVDREA